MLNTINFLPKPQSPIVKAHSKQSPNLLSTKVLK